MSYIDSHLLPGEHIVYRTQLHWKVYIVPVLFTLFILLPIVWLLYNGAWSHYAWTPLVVAVLILLGGPRLMAVVRHWATQNPGRR